MDEYISREETVKAFCEKCKGYYDGHCIHRGECDIDVIKNAPAADVQPVKHGHWEEEVREIGETFRLYQTYIHCSECGKEHYSGTLPKPNFCDECGADMRGAENE